VIPTETIPLSGLTFGVKESMQHIRLTFLPPHEFGASACIHSLASLVTKPHASVDGWVFWQPQGAL
jgi:hypothetical protein